VHKKIEEQSKAEQKDAWDQFKAELEEYFEKNGYMDPFHAELVHAE
jgi:hypothetical protein